MAVLAVSSQVVAELSYALVVADADGQSLQRSAATAPSTSEHSAIICVPPPHDAQTWVAAPSVSSEGALPELAAASVLSSVR
jgi:hypothetical protein